MCGSLPLLVWVMVCFRFSRCGVMAWEYRNFQCTNHIAESTVSGITGIIRVQSCRSYCGTSGNCDAFTVNVSSGLCYLYTRQSSATCCAFVPKEDLVSGSRDEEVLATSNPFRYCTGVNDFCAAVSGRRVFNHFGIRTFSAISDCMAYCESETSCLTYTYAPSTNNCFISALSGLGPLSESSPFYSDGYPQFSSGIRGPCSFWGEVLPYCDAISTLSPTQCHTWTPTGAPTTSTAPTQSPSDTPTISPTQSPSNIPTISSTQSPSAVPTVIPPTEPTNSSPNSAIPSTSTQVMSTSLPVKSISTEGGGGARSKVSLFVGFVVGGAAAFVVVICAVRYRRKRPGIDTPKSTPESSQQPPVGEQALVPMRVNLMFSTTNEPRDKTKSCDSPPPAPPPAGYSAFLDGSENPAQRSHLYYGCTSSTADDGDNQGSVPVDANGLPMYLLPSPVVRMSGSSTTFDRDIRGSGSARAAVLPQKPELDKGNYADPIASTGTTVQGDSGARQCGYNVFQDSPCSNNMLGDLPHYATVDEPPHQARVLLPQTHTDDGTVV